MKKNALLFVAGMVVMTGVVVCRDEEPRSFGWDEEARLSGVTALSLADQEALDLKLVQIDCATDVAERVQGYISLLHEVVAAPTDDVLTRLRAAQHLHHAIVYRLQQETGSLGEMIRQVTNESNVADIESVQTIQTRLLALLQVLQEVRVLSFADDEECAQAREVLSGLLFRGRQESKDAPEVLAGVPADTTGLQTQLVVLQAQMATQQAQADVKLNELARKKDREIARVNRNMLIVSIVAGSVSLVAVAVAAYFSPNFPGTGGSRGRAVSSCRTAKKIRSVVSSLKSRCRRQRPRSKSQKIVESGFPAPIDGNLQINDLTAFAKAQGMNVNDESFNLIKWARDFADSNNGVVFDASSGSNEQKGDDDDESRDSAFDGYETASDEPKLAVVACQAHGVSRIHHHFMSGVNRRRGRASVDGDADSVLGSGNESCASRLDKDEYDELDGDGGSCASGASQ